MYEYELQADAEFVFKKHGAYGASYFALIATGTNTYYSHYNRNTATLADGDLVQFDYAPDYKYYQSDVTRVFPANGTFTPRQRELYDDLPAALSGADDVDPGARRAARHHQGRRREDGRDHRVLHVHRREDQGGGARRSSNAIAPAGPTASATRSGMEVHDVGGAGADARAGA